MSEKWQAHFLTEFSYPETVTHETTSKIGAIASLDLLAAR
jgi:hypothetical protein